MAIFMNLSASLSAYVVEQLVQSYIELRKIQKEEDLSSDHWKALERAYFNHLRWRFEYPERAFKRQEIFSGLITALVLIMIIAGLVFSFLQLRYALSVSDFSNLETQIGLETAGKVSITSSIVGATVLIISLGFFYLYLRHVFRIQHPEPPHVRLGETDILAILNERVNMEGVSVQDIIKAVETQRKENSDV